MRRAVLLVLLLMGLCLPLQGTAVDLIIKDTGNVGHVIQQGGASLPDQPFLNFTGPGLTCTDSPGTTATLCTATGVRATNLGTVATTIGVNSDQFNEVRVAEITSASVNLTIPTGSPGEGQRLTYVLYSTVARTLTYDTTSGGFAGEAGLNLPPKTIAGSYLILEFRWSVQSNHWALVNVSDRRPKVTPFDLTASGSSVMINTNTTELATIALGASAQASYTVNLSGVATPYDGQVLRVRFTTTAGAPAKPLVWDASMTNNAGINLPGFTTGNGKEDDFGFQYNAASSGTWTMLASSQGNQSAIVKACIIALGDQVAASPLTNAQLGPRIRQCPAMGASGTVKEVGLYSDQGTPAIVPHRKSGASAAVDLVSSALAAGTGGTYACARITGDTLSQNGATTCLTTLTNTSYSNETSFGTTSGVAGGSATEVTVIVYYVPGG